MTTENSTLLKGNRRIEWFDIYLTYEESDSMKCYDLAMLPAAAVVVYTNKLLPSATTLSNCHQVPDPSDIGHIFVSHPLSKGWKYNKRVSCNLLLMSVKGSSVHVVQ